MGDDDRRDMAIPLEEERLLVDKGDVEDAAVEVRGRTETVSVATEYKRSCESIRVERVPVKRFVSEVPQFGSDGELKITPVFEAAAGDHNG